MGLNPDMSDHLPDLDWTRMLTWLHQDKADVGDPSSHEYFTQQLVSWPLKDIVSLPPEAT